MSGLSKKEQKKYDIVKNQIGADVFKKLRIVWGGIKARCYNKNNISYCYYGERGIRVCKEWNGKLSLPFIKWAIKSGYKPGLTIERKKNSGNYSPRNCKWVTPKEQNNNQRPRKDKNYIRYERKKVGINEVEKMLGFDREFLRERIINLGYCVKCAIELPKMGKNQRYKFKNHTCKNPECKFHKTLEQKKNGGGK